MDGKPRRFVRVLISELLIRVRGARPWHYSWLPPIRHSLNPGLTSSPLPGAARCDRKGNSSGAKAQNFFAANRGPAKAVPLLQNFS